jgi:shikimate kinase
MMETPVTREGRPCLEIVGVAGAGKSTIATALRRRLPALRDAVALARRRPFGLFTRAVLAARRLPILRPRPIWPSRRTRRKDRAYLDALYKVVQANSTQDRRPLLFDQGPIYRLARLAILDRGAGSVEPAVADWDRELEKWAQCLDLVVMLDAPDAILYERVLRRRKGHLLKQQSMREAAALLTDFRARYRYTLDLMRRHRTRMICFDTSQTTASEALEAIIAACRDLKIAS